MNLQILGSQRGSADMCEAILRALPDWFGIEESIVQYGRDVTTMPTFTAHVDGEIIGFLSVNEHFPHAAEIHVMGVLPEHHDKGTGRALTEAAERWLRDRGCEFLQVKTLIDRFKGREGMVDLDHRWTRRVTDVRQWFVFSASERWRDSDRFDERERLALEYAEAMTRSDLGVDDDLVERLRRHFDDDAVIELTGLIAFQNMSSKFNSALDVPPQGFCRVPGAAEPSVRDQEPVPQTLREGTG